MGKFMTKTLWFDFRTNTANEEIMEFPNMCKLMKLDQLNDVQILSYEHVGSQYVETV